MILIADGGSTKCDWLLTDDSGDYVIRARSKGLNPSMLTRKAIRKRLEEVPDLHGFRDSVDALYFYGAGCGTVKAARYLEESLREFFPNIEQIQVAEDIVGAAHSCTRTPAIVAILGTGSNCCFYNGEKVEIRMPSLGYSLMDDASGNHIGRLLLRAYYFEMLSSETRVSLEAQYDLSPSTVKKYLYKKKHPNAFLASFAQFVLERKEKPELRAILEEAVHAFARTHLRFFKDESNDHPVHFVGSVAFHMQEVIREVLAEYGFTTGNFVRRPIEGLFSYHTGQELPE